MVKAKKGLLFSLFALVVALVVTTTSTYAWFVMNQTVEATNMQITAKSDSKYLIIQSVDSLVGRSLPTTEGKIGDVDATSMSFAPVGEVSKVLPTKYKANSANTAGIPTWQTATGTNRSTGTASGDYTDITSNEGNYVQKFSFAIGIAPNSPVAGQNLKLDKLSLSTVSGDANGVFFKALSVLVVAHVGDTTTYAVQEYASAGRSAVLNNDTHKYELAGLNTNLADTVATDGTPVIVDVYVYINGDDANVTTQNATTVNLGTYGVDLSFSVSA